MLSGYYNTVEKPEILAAQGCGGTGRRIEMEWVAGVFAGADGARFPGGGCE